MLLGQLAVVYLCFFVLLSVCFFALFTFPIICASGFSHSMYVRVCDLYLIQHDGMALHGLLCLMPYNMLYYLLSKPGYHRVRKCVK